MKKLLNLLILIVLININTQLWAQETIKIEHKPTVPLKEIVDNQTITNFDFIIENKTNDSLKLTKILLRIYDKNNQLLKEKFLDNNGTAPSINLIPNKELNGIGTINIFNPFAVIPNNITEKLVYTFTFNNKISIEHTVFPKEYKQIVDFVLPVKNTTLVYDGHDYNAHHRRFDYEFAPIKNFGFSTNFMRYAYDFVKVDASGKMFKTDGLQDNDWFAFGSDILAVANGTIVAVEKSKLDNKQFDMAELKNNQMELFGNYIIIQHGDQLFTVYGHMKQNSSTLKTGDKVKQGQKIGEIGTSGSAFMPHLHFEVRNGSGANAEGLPSYFSDFSIVLGNTKQNIKYGTVNTGDIFISNTKK